MYSLFVERSSCSDRIIYVYRFLIAQTFYGFVQFLFFIFQNGNTSVQIILANTYFYLIKFYNDEETLCNLATILLVFVNIVIVGRTTAKHLALTETLVYLTLVLIL